MQISFLMTDDKMDVEELDVSSLIPYSQKENSSVEHSGVSKEHDWSSSTGQK